MLKNGFHSNYENGHDVRFVGTETNCLRRQNENGKPAVQDYKTNYRAADSLFSLEMQLIV